MLASSERLIPSLEWPGDWDRSLLGEGSEVPTMVISGSPGMGLNNQPAPENVALAESKEVSLLPR